MDALVRLDLLLLLSFEPLGLAVLRLVFPCIAILHQSLVTKIRGTVHVRSYRRSSAQSVKDVSSRMITIAVDYRTGSQEYDLGYRRRQECCLDRAKASSSCGENTCF